MINVQLDKGAFLPVREHPTDAGLDLFTPVDFTVPAHGFAFVDTGVHMQIPLYTRGHICSKSGLNRKFGLTADGTVDEGYTGTIGVIIHSSNDHDYTFHRGDKIAQIVLDEVRYDTPRLVAKITGSDRGNNGFGSTGL